jgi:hypothetical protein
MALGAALVDRARLIASEPTGERVEGTTYFAPMEGEWFRARLFLPAAQEGPDQPRGYRRAISHPQLMFGMRDAAGELVRLHFNDRVLVQSVEQDVYSVWKVNGEPQPIRKKRSMIGWLANLEKSLEREFVELIA